MTHFCVSKLTITGSDNGLSPGRRQAIIWTNAGILLIGPLGISFSEMLIEIYIFSFKKMHLKLSSGNWRPFCICLNVLIPRVLVPYIYGTRIWPSLRLPISWYPTVLGVGHQQAQCWLQSHTCIRYCDVIMGAMVSQITSLVIVYSIVNSGADHRKHHSSASLAFVRGIHQWLVNSPHKRPVTRKMFSFDDVIILPGFITISDHIFMTWWRHSKWLTRSRKIFRRLRS